MMDVFDLWVKLVEVHACVRASMCVCLCVFCPIYVLDASQPTSQRVHLAVMWGLSPGFVSCHIVGGRITPRTHGGTAAEEF